MMFEGFGRFEHLICHPGNVRLPKSIQLPRGKRSRAYVFWPVCFVQREWGTWVRTDVCVLLHPCPYCNVPAGQLCMGTHGPTAGTHHARRDLMRGQGRVLLDGIVHLPVE